MFCNLSVSCPNLSHLPKSGRLHTCSDIWTLSPPSSSFSCRQTADHSLSSSALPGSAPPSHGQWCQVRVPNFDSPTSKFTTNWDELSLLALSTLSCLNWTSSPLDFIFQFYFSFLFILTFLRREQVFTMQSCARCGFVVYPAEKINCIDQVTQQWCELKYMLWGKK